MKKFLLIPFLLFAVFSMAACGGSDEEPSSPEQPGMSGQPDGGDGNDDGSDTPAPGGQRPLSGTLLFSYGQYRGGCANDSDDTRLRYIGSRTSSAL